MLLKTKATKVVALLCILALAITAIIPSGFVLPKASAATIVTWDLKASPLVMDGDTTITGSGTTEVTKTYGDYVLRLSGQYEPEASHGIILKNYSVLEIDVPGPTKLTVGDCQYSNGDGNTATLAVKNKGTNTDISDPQTMGSKCYPSNEAVFTYKDNARATLVFDFSDFTKGQLYIPIITAEPIEAGSQPEVPSEERWDFRDGSVVPTSTTNGNTEITKGNLTIKPGSQNGYQYHGTQHGVAFKAGNSIEIKVSGPTKLTVGDCSSSDMTELTVKDKNGTYTETKNTKTGCYNGEGAGELVFKYTGSTPTTLVIEFTNTVYLPIIIAEPIEDKSEEEKPDIRPDDPTKTDVWDFGAEQLDSSKYNNMLTVDIINSWYPKDAKDGSSIGSFNAGDLSFTNGDGKTRIRTTTPGIIKFDDKNCTLSFADGTKTTGVVYSNSSGSDTYIEITLYAGDILTVYASANDDTNDNTIYFVPPSGDKDKKSATTAKDGAKLTFYASEYGTYKIYAAYKLVVARLLREHTNPVEVTGSVDTTEAAGIGSDYKIRFTSKESGAVKEAKVNSDGTYSVSLYDSHTYELSLVDANGYVIETGKELTVSKGSAGETHNIKIKQVALTEVNLTVSGLDATTLKNLKLEFNSRNEDSIYVPELTKIADGSYTVKFEDGVTYNVVASGDGINDYDLMTATIGADGGTTQTINFSKKPVYTVSMSYTGLPAEAKANAKLVFTNTEDKYVYTFGTSDTVKLRDGQYSIVVKNTGVAAVAHRPTSVKVNGADTSKEIAFEEVTVWDFSKYNAGNPGMDEDGAHYLGLVLSPSKAGDISENKTFLLAKSGEIKVPVKAGQLVTVGYCYEANFTLGDKKCTTASKDTAKIETASVTAEQNGYVTISVSATTYITSISLSEAVDFKSKITVGPNKDYQTINDALAAVANMERPNNERVEIVIDPGNYEEMLVISVPNVSLVNAAGKSSSLELTNRGVNIGANVVRITSYYGTGYNYYSMGSNNKWNADVLESNKLSGGENLTVNGGDGNTNGSYWNATVVVMADGFEANGIVFENSFNQYISAKEANDILVEVEGKTKGARPKTYGDTSVQDKKFVERAAAMAIMGDKSVFVNCKFVGRQDTLYGNKKIKAAFHECDVLGGTDFIFGGMIAVFYKCNLVMNTSDSSSSDRAYITAAQQDSGRGYLMYECTVTSTTPGKDTASTMRSKPGFFGRPWAANTSEVVFYKTTVETTDHTSASGKSLIDPAGWSDTLNTKTRSPYMYEYGTIEKSGEDNSASRADWAAYLTEPVLADGTEINIKAFLGDWTEELQARKLLLETESEPDPDDPDDPVGPADPEPGDDEPKDVVIESDNKDVKTEFSSEILPDGIDPADVVLSAEVLPSADNEVRYDLKFINKKDGTVIKVNGRGEIIVTLSVPEKFKNQKVYVYYVNNGMYEDMHATQNGDKVTFRTTHFSEYLMTTEVKRNPLAPSGGGDDDDDDNNSPSSSDSSSSSTSPKNPYTGVEPIIPVAAIIFAGGVVAVIFALIKRRKAK
ncbi:MAG: hypothetical protein J1F04_04695 [Oscillospiraceae bacterium]|nr:hypothetical protein [Oscillospiraceae bacterium]